MTRAKTDKGFFVCWWDTGCDIYHARKWHFYTNKWGYKDRYWTGEFVSEQHLIGFDR